MRNRWLKVLSFLLVGAFLAAAAAPVLAWSWSTNWSLPKLRTTTSTPTTPPTPPTPPPANPPPTNPPPANPPPTTGATALEQQMLDLLNQYRAQNGRKPLVLNPELSRLARLKAQDMVTNNYFDHRSPTLGYPPQMVQKAGITYRYGVGENLVEALTVTRAMMQLEASPTHKANLLDPGFTDVGIGIVPDHYGGIMGVQEFIGR
ncbi:MAG: CAP domain-containing protein [Methanocella sp.]